MSSVFKDMDQDDRLDALERKVKKLERNANGGNKMSGIIKELIGRECTIDGDGIYGHSCTILDAERRVGKAYRPRKEKRQHHDSKT